MKVIPQNFTVEKSFFDKDFFSYKGQQTTHVLVPFVGGQESVGFATNDPDFPVAQVVMRWIYYFDLQDGKRVMDFIANDVMLINTEDGTGNIDDYTKLVRSSYARYAMKWDELKAQIKFRQGLPLIQQDAVLQLAQKILNRIENKPVQ